MVQRARDFNAWLAQFKPVIASYDYYVDFEKAVANAQKWRPELYLLNSLLGSKNIESDFKQLVQKYPDTLNVVPTLLAVRATEVPVYEAGVLTYFQFGNRKQMSRVEDYVDFMRATGLFDLMENRRVTNLEDYVTGVEVGLDSNGRKNRSGHLMENLVESYLQAARLKRRRCERNRPLIGNPNEVGVYYKELNSSQAQSFWNIDLSEITDNGTVEKRFDFVVRTTRGIFGIETNFYAGGGSKLNETARSYKQMAQESEGISGFQFVWVTDGRGWNSARNNLRETYEIMDTIYNLTDLEGGVFKRLFAE